MRHAHRVAFSLAIVVATAFASAAILVADNAYTERDYRKALLAFNRRTLHDQYAKAGKKSDKWDANVIKLFDGLALMVSNYDVHQMYRLPGEPSREELKELSQTVIDAGCDEPLVRYARAILLSEENPAGEWLPMLEESAAQLNAGDEPSWRGMWAQHRVCQMTDPKDAAGRANEWERFKELAVNLITKWKYQGIDARIIYDQIWDTLDAQGPDYQQAFVKALRAKPGGDEWVREMIFGSADVKAAWHFRGGGWANTVTDGGWAGFYRHLGQAREHLAAAYKLQPSYPESATQMIAVAMGAGHELKESMRRWFEKAVAGQFDYAPAYSAYLWSIRPRWHGTIGQMYDFGVECAQTKRYDTLVPLVLMKALDDIASDMESQQFWRQPGVYEQVKELYDGMAASAVKRNAPDDADALRSQQAAFAWRVQRYDDARALLDALGDRLWDRAFERYNAMGQLAASHAYAMRPELSALVSNAEGLASREDIAGAIDAYEKARRDLKPADKALFFINSRIRQLQWQKQYDTGEWVDIQPGKDFAGWSPQEGKWEVDDQGGVVGTFVERKRVWLPCQGQFVRGNFVVEGNIELLGEQTCSAGVGMTYQSLDRIYGLYLQRDKAHQKTLFRRDFWPRAIDDVTLQPKNRFAFTFAAGRASATLNDKEIFRDYDVSYMWKVNRSYLGIGGWFGEPGSRIRFTNLRIRSVNTPAAAPAPQAEPEDVPGPPAE